MDTLWAALDNGRGGFITVASFFKDVFVRKTAWAVCGGKLHLNMWEVYIYILCLEVGTLTCDL